MVGLFGGFGVNILVSFQATQLRKTDASFLVKLKEKNSLRLQERNGICPMNTWPY